MTNSGGETAIAFYGSYAACNMKADRMRADFENNIVEYQRWAIEHQQEVAKQEYEVYSCTKAP